MGPRQHSAVVEPGSAQHKRQLNTSATKFGNCAFLRVRRYLMTERQHLKVRIEITKHFKCIKYGIVLL